MKVLIVDDEKLQLMRSEESVKNVLKDSDVFAYTNPLKALEETKEGEFTNKVYPLDGRTFYTHK